MKLLTHHDLRIFFLREGKFPGSVAGWSVESEPEMVNKHLALLIRELRDDLAAVTDEAQTSLFGVYIAACTGRTYHGLFENFARPRRELRQIPCRRKTESYK
jgi:hypothetical protein